MRVIRSRFARSNAGSIDEIPGDNVLSFDYAAHRCEIQQRLATVSSEQ